MVKDQRLGPGMPFLDSNTCTEGGGVIYFCQGFLPCMMPSMDGWRDGWMEKASRPRRPLLYVMLLVTKRGFGNLMFPLWFTLLGDFFFTYWTWVLPFCSLYSPLFGHFGFFFLIGRVSSENNPDWVFWKLSHQPCLHIRSKIDFWSVWGKHIHNIETDIKLIQGS
jgi:hypothetical protein